MSAKGPHSVPFNYDELAEDYATISYEPALRARAQLVKGAAKPKLQAKKAAAVQRGRKAARSRAKKLEAGAASSRKSATATLRMTAEENAQLQLRAVEAGISVSAYLRSCVFEAEALRAQVKGALAELRQQRSAPEPVRTDQPADEPGQSSRSWRERLLPRWSWPRTAH